MAEIQQWDEGALQTIRECMAAIIGLIQVSPPEIAEKVRQETYQTFVELGVDDHFYIKPLGKPD